MVYQHTEKPMETPMPATIRKTLLNIETTLIEGGRAAPRPAR